MRAVPVSARSWRKLTALGAVVLAAFYFCGLLDAKRLADGLPALLQIAREMVPPDFTRWKAWLGPLLDTLAMSIGGTAIAIALSLPLAVCAARGRHERASDCSLRC